MEMAVNNYIVASSKSWHRPSFDELRDSVPGNWFYVESPQALEVTLQKISPRYIFFLHWSWLVPESIWSTTECVCFHMTDVPYGRGGSPLQNLILRGHKKTKLTALKMVKELDAGPVYGQRELMLSGTAEEIYKRAGELSVELIKWLVKDSPKPTPQQGNPVVFERRRPEQSELELTQSNEALYDFIRMLDAPGYPKAFIKQSGARMEFSNARWRNGELVADVFFKKDKDY